MTLASHTSRIYMDEYDVEGAVTALRHAAQGCAAVGHTLDAAYRYGAAWALEVLLEHDRIDNQADFMTIFDVKTDGYTKEDLR